MFHEAAEWLVTMKQDIEQWDTTAAIILYNQNVITGVWNVTRACDISTYNAAGWSINDKMADWHKLVVIITDI